MTSWVVQWFPIDGFLAALCEGWQLHFIVEPARGSHGEYSVLLWRAA